MINSCFVAISDDVPSVAELCHEFTLWRRDFDVIPVDCEDVLYDYLLEFSEYSISDDQLVQVVQMMLEYIDW